MDLHDCRCLVALAEAAHFSRAADFLGIAQPSLSLRIKRLEASIGRPLFDRLPGRVVPTVAGQQLVVHARDILARMTDAERQASDVEGDVAGPVAIGAIPTIAPFVLPAVLKALAAKHPAVEPRVVEDVSDQLIHMLERGDLDVALLSAHAGTPTVHVETLACEPLLLLLAKGHRLAPRRAVAWEDLDGERFLVLHEMHCLSGQVSRVCERQSVRPPVYMQGAQLTTIAAMVSAGLGVSIVPAMMREEDTSNPTRTYLPFGKDAPKRDLTGAWSLARYRTQAARAVVEVARAHFKTAGPHSTRKRR